MSEDSSSSSRFGPVAAVVITLLVYLGSQLLAGLLIGLFLAISGKGTDELVNQFSESTTGQFSFILLVEIFTLGLLYWFLKKLRVSLADIGLGRWLRTSDIGYAFACFGVYFILLASILALVGLAVPQINLDQEQQIGFESATGVGALILVFISLVILPPIVEEIMVRGFLYSGLRHKFGRWGAALLASLVFGIAHLQLGLGAPPLYVAAIDTFVLSMLLIGLRERTGSLWAGMLVHALKNGLAFVALFILKVS